jgi:hypothetical protein
MVRIPSSSAHWQFATVKKMSNPENGYSEDEQITSLVHRRIILAPRNVRHKVYGSGDVGHHLWQYRDYTLLAIDQAPGLQSAMNREGSYGQPFPDLVSTDPRASGVFGFPSENRNIIIEDCQFDLGPMVAVCAGPDCSIVISRLRVSWRPRKSVSTTEVRYKINTAYILRFGSRILKENSATYFEDLISHHISKNR